MPINTTDDQIKDQSIELYRGLKFDQFEHAYPSLAISAGFKTFPEDFIVDEKLPFELSGEGEHAWLHIQKRDCNTDWVAKALAKIAGVRLRCVGYAGLKDRHGLTSQWFSVHLPGQPDPDWKLVELIEGEEGNIKLLEAVRHSRKLRRGALKENRFTIRLRGLKGGAGDLTTAIDQRCQLIAERGVPNYFGEQRFGHGMANLSAAAYMFSNDDLRLPRHKKSIYLSASRSWIFNRVLSKRVERDVWDTKIPGDVFMLEGKTACFWDDGSSDLDERIRNKEIHPTALLWGEGELRTQAEAAELENQIVDENPVFKQGLCKFKVQQMRRSLRLVPTNMTWQLQDGDLLLSFDLPSGCYATMVLRELLDVNEPAAQFV
ncbi:MAG: tRNA pseudouridine(13) synthase TruD [Gammaproteobacteria bacterium]|nr:tRNA pseudouridine(13) synthase TruD [Gammaproteobacteria bacterium]MCK5262637.1 tRNA pseudouridine(13) synthase TruD [Gammaproteobacteria bacterium]